MKIGPLEFACNFLDWLLTLGEHSRADRGLCGDLLELCVRMCVCVSVVAAAVAQREQLHSAQHTSFVLGLSWLANALTPLLHKAQTKALDQRRASGDFGGGTWSEFTVPACGWRETGVSGPRLAVRD